MRAAFAAGFAACLIWLGFIGVPLIVPSYVELAVAHRTAAAAAGAQQERGDAIEDLRGEEHREAVSSVEAERSDCDARLAARDALWSARMDRLLMEEPETNEAPVCRDFRPVRDSLRDAGLADG